METEGREGKGREEARGEGENGIENGAEDETEDRTEGGTEDGRRDGSRTQDDVGTTGQWEGAGLSPGDGGFEKAKASSFRVGQTGHGEMGRGGT